MPGFVSHTVMAHDVYRKIDSSKVDINYLVTYSLGGDLCKYAKCRYDSHHTDMDKFIYTMADYIKDNKLENNKKVMGVLYGHICHYVMDSVIHPLVRKVDKSCVKNKNNHTLIEEYYDSYLVKERYKIDKRVYLRKGILKSKNNRDVNKLINYIYLNIYKTKNVSIYYQFNLFLYRLLSRVYIICNKGVIEKIIKLDKFLINNSDIDLFNDDNKIRYKDYLNRECSDNLISLYDESVLLAYEYINNVNEYLGI